MPFQPILPTWLAWNNANFPTASGIQDLRTGQDFPAGGLNLGDYFDATEQEANNASALNIGLLHHGRYRLVQVDSGATAANVKTGTVGYLRAGLVMQGVVPLTLGSGQTPGTYTVAATVGSGGGAGAVIQVVIGAGGTLSSVTVLQGGANYVTVPTFVLPTGGTPATVAAQLSSSPNRVTSFDQATTMKTLVREVIFLNSITPGNYGFVQELGLATVLGFSTIGTGNENDWVNAATGGAGTVNTTAASGSPIGTTVGQAIDKPIANQLFKCYLMSLPIVQD